MYVEPGKSATGRFRVFLFSDRFCANRGVARLESHESFGSSGFGLVDDGRNGSGTQEKRFYVGGVAGGDIDPNKIHIQDDPCKSCNIPH